ncbi:GNAT family N-acetyltransferase [bacterium]|nr:GNAT family N-acetyltransferase [bacterium]
MITLQRPRENLATSYFEFMEEMRQQGEKIWEGMIPKPGEPTPAFVLRLLGAETHPEPGLVAETSYWACEGERVVGRIALRHHLNESLKEFGGHIGYEVRPSCRKRGIAKEMLRQLLQTTKAREIEKLLLTCAPDNTASNKTILANGGSLAKTAYVEKWQRDTNYYWISLARE